MADLSTAMAAVSAAVEISTRVGKLAQHIKSSDGRVIMIPHVILREMTPAERSHLTAAWGKAAPPTFGDDPTDSNGGEL